MCRSDRPQTLPIDEPNTPKRSRKCSGQGDRLAVCKKRSESMRDPFEYSNCLDQRVDNCSPKNACRMFRNVLGSTAKPFTVSNTPPRSYAIAGRRRSASPERSQDLFPRETAMRGSGHIARRSLSESGPQKWMRVPRASASARTARHYRRREGVDRDVTRGNGRIHALVVHQVTNRGQSPGFVGRISGSDVHGRVDDRSSRRSCLRILEATFSELATR